MLTTNTTVLNYYKKADRQFDATVTINGNSYLVPYQTLVSFSIERSVPNGKFFGYAVSQRVTIEVLGTSTAKKYNSIDIAIGGLHQNQATLPRFYVDTVEYNSAKNTTTITGYDALEYYGSMIFKDSSFTYPMTLLSFAQAMVSRISSTLSADFEGVNPTIAKETLNLDGTETYKDVFAAIAEATGTICYCSTGKTIVFKTLPKATADNVGHSFDGSNYFDFSTSESVTLGKIASVTELGDNIEVGSGRLQIIRENPFLVLRSDIASLLDAIYQRVNGITITSHNLNFRGNPFYEIGDLLAVDTTKGVTKYIHYLSGTFTYDGGISSTTNWEDGEVQNVEAAPTNLNAAITQTFAKVDKANKQIDLVVSEVEGLNENVSKVTVKTDEISQTVSSTKENVDSSITNIYGEIDTLTKRVQTTMTPDNVSILIQKELTSGVNSVKTRTGFTFDENGLTVEKSGSEMNTTISEDGMTIYRGGDKVLVANNQGVEATNLHATTYLIIGINSRFEDYDNQQRTGCFWINN